MKATFVAASLALLAFIPLRLSAQESIIGTYSGHFMQKSQRGERSRALHLVISNLEGDVASARLTRQTSDCGGEHPMQGKYDGNRLKLRSTEKGGAAADCSLSLDLTVEGKKLVGTTGRGEQVQLSK